MYLHRDDIPEGWYVVEILEPAFQTEDAAVNCVGKIERPATVVYVEAHED